MHINGFKNTDKNNSKLRESKIIYFQKCLIIRKINQILQQLTCNRKNKTNKNTFLLKKNNIQKNKIKKI